MFLPESAARARKKLILLGNNVHLNGFFRKTAKVQLYDQMAEVIYFLKDIFKLPWGISTLGGFLQAVFRKALAMTHTFRNVSHLFQAGI